jgi:effector-binding domain-containing protein
MVRLPAAILSGTSTHAPAWQTPRDDRRVNMLRCWPVPLTLVMLAFGCAGSGLAAPVEPQEQSHEQPVRPPTSQPNDAFGEEVTLPERTIIYFSGSGRWDSAFETILDGFKTVYGFLDKQGIKPAGAPMTIYTATDDAGFSFEAAVPVEAAPANPPQGDIALGRSPAGKALKFIHRGSYDAMDSTYEAITNYLDEKSIDSQDLFVEQYLTDPLTTAEDKLVVEIYVPVK